MFMVFSNMFKVKLAVAYVVVNMLLALSSKVKFEMRARRLSIQVYSFIVII